MLVDTFIITVKEAWRDVASYTTAEDALRMEMLIPENYRPLFAHLVGESLNELMDTRDHVKAYETMAKATVSGKEGPWYARKGECLQQILRRIFYDTLLIIRGDYNPFKYDYVIVVHSKEVLTEREWQVTRDLNGASRTSRPGNGQVLVGHFSKIIPEAL